MSVLEGRLPLGTRPAAATPGAARVWVCRVNPTPRRRFADDALARAVAGLADADRAVLDETARSSDALFHAVGRAEDETVRAGLVALRRTVRHGRALPTPLPDGAPRDVLAALEAARARRDEAREEVSVTAAPALWRERVTLADLLRDEPLRASLALVAPDVADAAGRYVTALSSAPHGDGVPARLLKSERGLVQYVSRALLRTSPLARFTAVGLATEGAGGVALDDVRPDGAVPFLSLDRVMLDYVLGGLVPSDGDPGQTWVQLPPTAAVDPAGGRVHFLRVEPASGGMKRLAAPLEGVVRLLVDAVAMGPRRLSALVDALVGGAGATPEEARAAVDKALDSGLLCRAVGPVTGDADTLEALAEPSLAEPALRETVRARAASVRDSAPTGRREELDALRSSLGDLSRAAGRPAAVAVEEDLVLPPVTVATGSWGAALEDLAGATELMSAFDRLHDVRALLCALFVERFGAGARVPLTAHADGLVDALLRRTDHAARTGTAPAGPADGSLEELQRFRRRVWDTVHDELSAAAERGEDVTWSAGRARALVADLPARFRREPLSYGVLAQPSRHRLVFNDAYAGHGMLFGRFLAADRALGGAALPTLAARLQALYAADGARVVEDTGLHRLNVNAHAPVLPDALGAGDWSRLSLAHDRDTDTLRVQDEDGRHVRVLNLGAGHPDLLPPPVRLAVWLVSGGRLMEDLVGGWHDATDPGTGRTRPCPRLSVGSVVLARRRWYGGEELDTALSAGPDPGDRLVSLTEWRSRHDVPAEVVLTSTPEYDYRYPSDDGADARRRARREKPQYVDLASALTSRVLPRLVQRRGGGYVEEALPAPGEGRHALEWVVEVARPSGGAFACEEAGS